MNALVALLFVAMGAAVCHLAHRLAAQRSSFDRPVQAITGNLGAICVDEVAVVRMQEVPGDGYRLRVITKHGVTFDVASFGDIRLRPGVGNRRPAAEACEEAYWEAVEAVWGDSVFNASKCGAAA